MTSCEPGHLSETTAGRLRGRTSGLRPSLGSQAWWRPPPAGLARHALARRGAANKKSRGPGAAAGVHALAAHIML